MLILILIVGLASMPILKDLDRTMSQKAEIEAEKTAKIQIVRTETTDEYERLDRLYEEYYQYNIDSAIFYANKKMAFALAERNSWRIIDSKLDLANRYLLSGMYTDAMNIIADISLTKIDDGLKTRLYNTCCSIYNGLAETSDDAVLKRHYLSLSHDYRSRLRESLGRDDIARLFIDTDIARENGHAAEALQPVLTRIEQTESIHDRAILHYLAANIYKDLGDDAEAIEHYSYSAIYDLTTPVKEYRSLYELAFLLYKAGDIDRAFRYITRSIEDANSVKAKINIDDINRTMPLISAAYDSQVRKRHSEMKTFSIIISLGLIMLAILSAACLVAIRRTRAANAALVQANSLKEFYIARYIDMCSDYIDGLDHFRNEMRKIAQGGNITKVLNALKSKELIETELKALYASFDASFLDIYPDFVQSVNSLLRDDCQIELNDGKNLTTELRVAALLRLGVTDSADIAHFLRRSVSTIYNCRVHLRNCARSDRDSFESRIMQIDRF